MDPDRLSALYNIRKRLRKGSSEEVFGQFVTLGGYSAIAALILFAIHVLMARMLGQEQYAGYGTYLAIIFTVFFALTSIHLIITRFVAYHKTRFQYEQINYVITLALRRFFVAGGILFITVLIFAKPISSFFGLTSIASTAVLGFVLWFMLLSPVYEGAFKGMGEFSALGKMRITESIFRLAFVLLFVLLGFGVPGALFGIGLGTFFALMLSFKHLQRILKLNLVKPGFGAVRRFAVPVVITMTSIALLLNLDIIFVKHFFPAAEAGVFAAASVIAKVPFLVSMVFVSVMFPQITRLHADGKPSSSVLLHAVQVVAPLVALFTILAFFFSEPLLSLLFGPEYALGGIFGFYMFGMGALALATLLAIYLLAIRKDTIAFMLPLFVLAFIVLLTIFHSSLLQIIIVVMLTNTALFAYMLYAARNEIDFDYFL